MSKPLNIKDALGAKRAMSLFEMIEFGNDLVASIKEANWSYNNKKGLPHPTDHMKRAIRNWQGASERE